MSVVLEFVFVDRGHYGTKHLMRSSKTRLAGSNLTNLRDRDLWCLEKTLWQIDLLNKCLDLCDLS